MSTLGSTSFPCGPEEDPVVSSVPVVFIFNNGRYEVEYVRFRTPAVLSEARNMAEEAAFWRMNADQDGAVFRTCGK
jgi:hypothetical protein